jgi:tetratricopeptide (TPR) repeat protein
MTISTVAFFTLRGRTTNENPSANAFATLADSSRLQVAFLPVVAGPQDSLLARTLVSAQIRALQGDRRVLLRTPDQIAALAVTADYPVTSSPDSLKTFYRDLGVHAYVVNTIARTGSGALLVAEGYATNSDSVLFRVEAPANSAADLSAATASLTEGTLAGARRSFGKVFPPLRVGRLFGTTAEAARLYAESGEYFARQEYLTVVKKMRLALSIDSNFVIGWSTLAAALGNGNLGAAERFEASRQAYRLRSQIRSRVARVSAETQYLLAVGDAEGALAVAKAGTREFPTASDLKILLALVYARRREDELAMQVLRPVAEQELDRRQLWVGVGNFGLELLRLGRIAEAEALSRRAESVVGRMTVGTVQQRYGIAQATFDVEGIAQAGRDRLALATTEPTRLAGYSILRTAMAMSGRLDSASHIEAKRRSILRELEVGLLGVQSIADEALWRAMFLGDRSRSVALLDSGLVAWNWSALPSLDRSYPFVVQVRVAAGHIAEARRLVDEWERGVPEDLARAQRPLIEWARGEIALAEGRAPESLTHFRAGDVGGCRSCVFPRLARAFDGMQNADSTIYWYEKYLATPTFDPNVDSRELARAYRRLGELYDAKGDTKRALRRYSDFVELWKNADPALQPTVKDARERIARLQRTKG